MYEIPPSELLASLLQAFHRMGDEVEYVQIGLEEQDQQVNLVQRHKAAAIFTAQILINRAMQHLSQLWLTEKVRWQQKYPGLTQSTRYRVLQQ